MRRLLTTGLLLSAMTGFAQTAPQTDSRNLPLLRLRPRQPTSLTHPANRRSENNVVVIAEAAWKATGGSYEPCSITRAMRIVTP